MSIQKSTACRRLLRTLESAQGTFSPIRGWAWFDGKQKAWASTAQRLQSNLNAWGFVGPNGSKLAVDRHRLQAWIHKAFAKVLEQ